jgi:threonine dehydrogenase-like Zn-dependent dehydrogenase
MKSLLLKEYLQLELADFPEPEPGPGEVLIRVAACGICGSDVHGYDGTSGRPIPPIVMGHEAAGNVAATVAGVSRFIPGDRVTFDSTVYCGECAFCKRGEVNLCDRREVIGVCNPPLAHQALQHEFNLGLLLPCDPPRKTLPHEVGNFGLRGLVCARLAGTIAVNVTQVMVSSKRLETEG